MKDMNNYEEKLEQFLSEHNCLSLYGEYEQEDADGCFMMVLNCAYMKDGCVMVDYEKQITCHETHSTETFYEENFFTELDTNIQIAIFEQMED